MRTSSPALPLWALLVVLSHSSALALANCNGGHVGTKYMAEAAGVNRSHTGELHDNNRRDVIRASRLFKVLSRRSVGRYVLATSALAGECARVYAPAPLDRIAVSLSVRFGEVLAPRRYGERTSNGNKGAGLNYDRFFPNTDEGADDRHQSVDSIASAPDKYGRVSSAFLRRHGIGPIETQDLRHMHQDEDESSPSAVVADNNNKHIAEELLEDASASAPHRQEPPRSQGSVGAVFRSLSKLGQKRARLDDDHDLLSETEEEAETLAEDVDTRVGRSATNTGWNPDGRDFQENSSSTSRNAVQADRSSDRVARVDGLGRRNLVNNVDEGTIELVQRLRDAAASQSGSTGQKPRRHPRSARRRERDKGMH